MTSLEIGRAVEYHRRRARITRKQLSMMCGLSQSAIYHVEKGRSTMQLNSLQNVLQALNMELVIQGPLMDEYQQSTAKK